MSKFTVLKTQFKEKLANRGSGASTMSMSSFISKNVETPGPFRIAKDQLELINEQKSRIDSLTQALAILESKMAEEKET